MLVLRDLPDEFGAITAQACNGILNVIAGKLDATCAQLVDQRIFGSKPDTLCMYMYVFIVI